MGNIIKNSLPLKSGLINDYNVLSEGQKEKIAGKMYEWARRDIIETPKLGFVTFADILGWKGIWKDEKRKPLEEIIKIKRDLEVFKQKIYKEHLIKCYKAFTGEEIVEKSLEDNNYKLEEVIKEELIKLKKSRKDIDEFFSTFDIEVTLDLISDTFVITSRPKSIRYHMSDETLTFHLKIAKQLIIECLKGKLLIRGATSYGDFQKEESVFIGPAIDESASWHEQGEEIGIFLTPSAYMNFIDFRMKDLVELRKPKLKKNNFETLVINWREGADKFYNICKLESPLIPEIAPKYLNTLDYLNSLPKE